MGATKSTIPAQLRREVGPALVAAAAEEHRSQTDTLSAALLFALRHRDGLRAELAAMPGRPPAGEGRRFKKKPPAP